MWFWISLILLFASIGVHLRWKSRFRRAQLDIAGLERLQQLMQEEHARDRDREHIRQQTIFDGMLEGVAILDSQGTVQSSNLAFRRFLNITQETRGRRLDECVSHPDIPRLLERLARDGQVLGLEIILPGPPVRVLQANGNRLSGDQLTLLVFHDQTRIKELERMRKEFVANVSHELRTPLSLIKGFVETLMGGTVTDPVQAQKFLQTINKHTDRLTYLIEDLLTLSRLEGGQVSLNRKPTGLAEAAQQVMEDLETRAREQSVQVVNLIPEDMTVFVDAERLQQVFFNLLENAIKYGKVGGTVEIGAKSMVAGGVEVWVKDDGPGIPEESRTRVFERFYRVDRARARDTGGTGLGLAIVKHIVQIHGGEVWVNSEIDKGSTFHFTLPAENEAG